MELYTTSPFKGLLSGYIGFRKNVHHSMQNLFFDDIIIRTFFIVKTRAREKIGFAISPSSDNFIEYA